MPMVNIKSGLRKCGIYPFNPNAINKDHLLKNIDLAVSPTTPFLEVSTQTVNSQAAYSQPHTLNTPTNDTNLE